MHLSAMDKSFIDFVRYWFSASSSSLSGQSINKLWRLEHCWYVPNIVLYVVSVDKPISQTFVERMYSGVPILNTTTKQCKVKKISQKTFKIVLTQGLNRQIRRMCEYLGYEVKSLQRTRIMNIHLKSSIGTYRELSEEELTTLNSLLKNSKKTW